MPNDDLISRKALLSGFDVRKVTEYDESGCGVNYKAVPVNAIECAPAVDAEPVRHGKWEIINRNEARCSECKKIRNIGNQIGWNFCPNCGAKMDKE